MSFKVEFGTLAEANEIREEMSEHLCSVDDDRRLKTVTFASDTPDDVREDVRERRLISKSDDRKRYGQLKLGQAERDQLKRSRRGWNWNDHGFEAMAAKAALVEEGASDWMNYYEKGEDVAGALKNLEAAKERSAEVGAPNALRSEHRDDEMTEAEMGRKTDRARGERCNHAEEHCEHGDPDACEFLADHCGFSEDQVSAILDEDGDVDDLPGPVYGALGKQWQRYRVGLANAKEAAAVINEIQAANDQDLVEFEELGGRSITKSDITW